MLSHAVKVLAGCCLTLTAAAQTAQTAPIQSRDSIREAAAQHASAMARDRAPEGTRVEIEPARLDSRLRLARCASEIETFDPPGARFGNRVSVGVRCPDGWSLYVPVNIAVYADVVVLERAVARGATLSAGDIGMANRDVSGLRHAYLRHPEQAIGQLLRRPVTPGHVLHGGLLDQPNLIRRGDRVTIEAGASGFAITSEGEALADAAAGDRLKVRNLGSKQVIEGIVDESGHVVAR